MFKLEKLTDKAILTIYGYVGGAYLDFRAVNAALDDISKSGYAQMDFRLHTYGGDVFEGNLIYNFIASFKGQVDFYIDGVAASMGAILVRAGARVHIAENGFQMIHAPKGGAYGTAKQFIQTAKLLTSMEKNFIGKLVDCTGKPIDEVKQWFDGTDYWFDADECVSLGLATDKFDPIVKNIKTLDKEELAQIGAEAAYNRFAAALIAQANVKDTIIKNSSEMTKEDLIKRYGLTDVTAQSSDEEILAAVDKKIKAGENKAKEVTMKAIEVAVDQAITDKKITKEQRDKYIARGEKLGLEDLNETFADMKVYEPISGKITGKKEGGKTPEDRTEWTWDDYQAKASAELEAMPKSDPETFKALYKAKYGVEPEI